MLAIELHMMLECNARLVEVWTRGPAASAATFTPALAHGVLAAVPHLLDTSSKVPWENLKMKVHCI